jgi:hypothetical protein
VAHAGPPPKGKYECTIGYPPIGFGTIVIKADGVYKRGYDPPFKKGGKYKNPKGKQIKFTTGPLKGIKGHWEKTESGPELELRNPEDNFEDIYCLKRK